MERAWSDRPTAAVHVHAAVPPAEVWLARRLRTPLDTNARVGTRSQKPSQYAKEVKGANVESEELIQLNQASERQLPQRDGGEALAIPQANKEVRHRG